MVGKRTKSAKDAPLEACNALREAQLTFQRRVMEGIAKGLITVEKPKLVRAVKPRPKSRPELAVQSTEIPYAESKTEEPEPVQKPTQEQERARRLEEKFRGRAELEPPLELASPTVSPALWALSPRPEKKLEPKWIHNWDGPSESEVRRKVPSIISSSMSEARDPTLQARLEEAKKLEAKWRSLGWPTDRALFLEFLRLRDKGLELADSEGRLLEAVYRKQQSVTRGERFDLTAYLKGLNRNGQK